MIRIATRSSALAMAQARHVADLLGGGEIVAVSAEGESGDKSRFVRGVEQALLDSKADLAVHSAKDLPGEMTEGLVIAAVPVREDASDVWVEASSPRPGGEKSGGGRPSLDTVPRGARVGTASLRRRAQLLAARPDLEVVEVRGNVDTRLAKLAAGEVDALVLAAAGLRRLGREAEIAFAIPVEEMVPAPGQGALAVQAREGGADALAAATAIGDERALRELAAERATVALLEASCDTPIGVRARDRGDAIEVEAFVGLPDGSEWIRDRIESEETEPTAAGALLAERLLAAGARDLLDRAEAMA